ncbi:MAG: M36 family metallopeptidase [candidate division WOR-3 bacterium]
MFKKIFLILFPILLFALKEVKDEYSVYRKNYHPSPKLIKRGDFFYDVETGKPLTGFNLKEGPYTGSIEEKARKFIGNFQNKLMLDSKAELRVFDLKNGLKDLTHIRFREYYKGVPIFGSELVITFKGNYVTSYSSRLFDIKGDIDVEPLISKEMAYEIAKNFLPIKGKIHKYIEPELIIYPYKDFKLSYRVLIPSSDPIGDWEFFVDAKSGEVLFVRDQAKYFDGQGYSFNPDPLTTAHRIYNQNSYWADNNDADNDSLNGQRFLVPLLGLTDSSGWKLLKGPHAYLIDWDAPSVPVVKTQDGLFYYTRSQSGFEDAMVYYGIDNIQRYIQSLGFNNVNNEPQDVDPHGVNGQDNSYYVPSTDRIAYGEGGVDDAEDMDVILHEYGHAIQDDQVPGWGASSEADAMGEGFGDYLSASYSIVIDTFKWAWVFNWDGHNPFWPGRSVNMDNYHYPEDAPPNREIHDAGQLWSSALFDVMWALFNMYNSMDSARKILDKLVIQHHFYLTASATMPEAAQAILQADNDINNRKHWPIIIPIFDARGFIDASQYLPQIIHTSLPDNENVFGPYTVLAKVIPSTAPIDSVFVYYWISLLPQDTVKLIMQPTGNPDEYSANIPGPGQDADINYYIYARDQNGNFNTHPQGAPLNHHSFHVGEDTVKPVIVHTPVRTQYPISRWPAKVKATITDNIGVDTAYVEWVYNGNIEVSFGLTNMGNNVYEANFPLPSVNLGDTIEYRIVAVDASSTPDTAKNPVNGFYKFYIVESRGIVLVLNDDSGDRKWGTKIGKKDDWLSFVDYKKAGESADSIASWLSSIGFDVTKENIWQTDTLTWNNYDVLVLSSGLDVKTVAQDDVYGPVMRSALKNFVSRGGKLLVEGGEIGFDAQVWNPDFGTQVLHINDWDSDYPGNLNIYLPNHPIANSPNTLPSQIVGNFSGQWGVADALKLEPDAYFVYNWTSYQNDGGIIVHDTNQGEPNVVFMSINILSISDKSVAKALLENCVEYLIFGATPIKETQKPLNFVLDIKKIGRDIKINFTLSEPQRVEIKVFDVTGRKNYGYSKMLKRGTYTHSIVNLKPGIYFVSFKTDKNLSEIKKAVILK